MSNKKPGGRTTPKGTRPPTKKKAPPADSDAVVRFKVGDKIHTLDYALIGAKDERAIRRETGMSFDQVIDAFTEAPGLDLVAVMVWRARIQAGETGLTLEEVEEGITFSTEMDVIEDDDLGEDPAGG